MITLEQIQEYLPKYLSPKQQQDLAAQLRDFENRSYYTNLHETEMLQGDGWTKIEIVDLTTGTRDKIKGILLSNSCDIAASNVREFPPRIVFAPLIPLHAFADLLKQTPNLKPEQIDSKIDSIRKQRVTSLFYLPRGAALDSDHIAVLDDLHNIPLQRFLEDSDRTKVFTLGQMGFYLFLFKISIHFCGFQEGISRSP
jgi:hypothetical protein